MHDRCERTHANLLAGTCPWCGQAIIKGKSIAATAYSAFAVALPLPSGITLKNLVSISGPLEYQTAARYIEQVAKQLAGIHLSGKVHRDVRTEHIFVDEKGIATLAELMPSIDEADASPFVSKLDEVVVTSIADYLAPEQALASQTVDARTDIYSLGCTMYFLLTGRPPFPFGSISERLLQHQTAAPEKILNLRLETPTALIYICEKMLAKKPSDRIQTATEVAEYLAAWLIDNESNG